MTEIRQASLKEFFQRLAEKLARPAWTWDPRFGCVLCELKVPEEREDVLAVLRDLFSDTWTSAEIADAPDVVQTVRRHLGGVMFGQILFTCDSADEGTAYCAWWPWGDGRTTSIRVGWADGPEEGVAVEATLRDAFRVS